MKRHITWPSIGQFRETVKNIQHQARYIGKDADGAPMYNAAAVPPKLTYEGTVKLHGTNAAACFGSDGEYWFQSRSNIITPLQDNAGFAMYGTSVLSYLISVECNVRNLFPDSFSENKDVVIFGEWCGAGIQKGVAISELHKMFVIFGIALVDQENNKTYLTREHIKECVSHVVGEATHIFNIFNFQTFEVEIDFNNPHLIQNELGKLTEFVEECCPVGWSFGVDGVGEGIVWRPKDTKLMQDSGNWFKVKGEKHANSKVRTLASVDVERIESIKELAETLANNGRLEQMHQSVFNTLNGGETDIKLMGEFIKAVSADILKEELDVIAASGFAWKEVAGYTSKMCKEFIMKKLEV